jgi:predicted transcriptional regulator
MRALSIRIPEDLKTKAMHLARKKNMSFNALVNHWLQAAILQDETIEWMKRRLSGKNPELLITEFGHFLDRTKPGPEPTLDEIEQAMQD